MSERLWHMMAGDKTYITKADVLAAMAKYKKSVPSQVAAGLVAAFDRERRQEMNYDQFCAVVNRYKLQGQSSLEAVLEECKKKH